MKTLTIAVICTIISLVCAFNAQAQSQTRNEGYQVTHPDATILRYRNIQTIMSIDLAALDTYTVSSLWVEAQGGAQNLDYLKVFVIDENNKVLGSADQANGYDKYLIPIHLVVVKGKPRKLTIAVSAMSWYSREHSAMSFVVSNGNSDSKPGFYFGLYAYSTQFYYNSGYGEAGSIYVSGTDAEIASEARVGQRTYLGGFRFDMSGASDAIITKPTFRVYTTKGKPTDLLRLELVDELGRVIGSKPKVSDCGEYAKVTFPQTIEIPQGVSSVFIRGAMGTTYRGGGTATITLEEADQTLPNKSSGAFISFDFDSNFLLGGSVKVK
jgi:hypothetical protein